jgi:hypothetical protein
MTVSEMAVPYGTTVPGVDSPRVLTRTRARTSVADGDGARVTKQARRAPVVVRLARVMYLDAADSWIVSDSTPSIRTVWKTSYVAAAPAGWLPFVIWCHAYRVPAVLLAAVLDAVKWLLIHPLRGPLSLTVAGGLLAAWTL